MSNKLLKYIEINPNILDGTPVIVGTRIPLERLTKLVGHGYTTESLREEYPQVDTKTIQFIMSKLMEEGLNDIKKTYKTQTSAR